MESIIYIVILLYTLLVIYFARYKKYMICLISLSKFSDVLPAFTCARAIGKLLNNCLGDNILSSLSYVDFIGNIPLSKTLRVNSRSK